MANRLATRLRELAEQRGDVTRKQRPTKIATIRIRNLKESLTKEEIAKAIEILGECKLTDVSVGNFNGDPRGSVTTTALCPLAVAIKVTPAGRIPLGWMRSRIDLLATRPLICFRCVEKEHVRGQCRSTEDLSFYCYRCNYPGHRVQECTRQPSCPVWKKAGLSHNHEVREAVCKPAKEGGKGRKKGTEVEKEASLRKASNTGVGGFIILTLIEAESPEASLAQKWLPSGYCKRISTMLDVPRTYLCRASPSVIVE